MKRMSGRATKAWQQVADFVKTRTAVQCQTHFEKCETSKQGSVEAVKASPPQPPPTFRELIIAALHHHGGTASMEQIHEYVNVRRQTKASSLRSRLKENQGKPGCWRARHNEQAGFELLGGGNGDQRRGSASSMSVGDALNKKGDDGQRKDDEEDKEEEDDGADEQQEDNARTWVQCSSCRQWRQLEHGVESWKGEFRCAMNTWDKELAHCDVAEDTSVWFSTGLPAGWCIEKRTRTSRLSSGQTTRLLA